MAHELLPPVNEPAILGVSKGQHNFDKEHLAESARKSKGYYLTSQGITFTGFKNYCEKLIQIGEMSEQGRRKQNYLLCSNIEQNVVVVVCCFKRTRIFPAKAHILL